MTIASVVLIVAGLLVGVTTELCASGRIGRNGFVGLRLAPLYDSDEAWRIGHRAARVWTWLAAASAVVSGVLGFVVSDENDYGAVVLVGTLVMVVLLGVSCVAAYRAGVAVRARTSVHPGA